MRISVVIPLYNKRDSIKRTLKSVLNQSFKPFEIIMVDDGSTDGSGQVVNEVAYLQIRLFHQNNAGASAARNRGILEAKGEWIAFLDADDEWKPHYLETIKMLAETYPQCSTLATAYEIENYLGERKSAIINKLQIYGEHGILGNYFEVASCSNPPLWTSAVVVKKEAIVDIRGFPEGIKAGEDLLVWAKLSVKYQIAYSKKSMAVFILDVTHSVSEKPIRLPDNNDYIGTELIGIYNSSKGKSRKYIRKYISLWYKMRASVYLRNSERSNVWKNSLISLRYNFCNYKNYLFLLLSFMPRRIQKLAAKIHSS